MKFIVDHDLHIHSMYSKCSNDPEQTPERILQYAKENNLKKICITDHFWDENVPGASNWYNTNHKFTQISRSKPLPKADGIEFLFGCETELDKHCTLGISKERYDKFDIIIIPTTHMHMNGFTVECDHYCNPSHLAKLWIDRLDAVLDMDLPFYKVGIAHLTCTLIAKPREVYLETLRLINTDEMYRVFKKASMRGVGIEINGADMIFSEEEKDVVLRPYKIAKECGCKFYCGSDAHHVNQLDIIWNFERLIDLLDLKESDKWDWAKQK